MRGYSFSRVSPGRTSASQGGRCSEEYVLEEDPPAWLNAAFAAHAIGQGPTEALGAYPTSRPLRAGIAFDQRV